MMEQTRDAESYELTRFNALSHGVLSRYVVLPWENAGEYRMLVAALVAEHGPNGPTEQHLVEEIAGVVWRKRRLRIAEAAAHRSQLVRTFASCSETAKAAVAHLGPAGTGENVASAVRADGSATAEAIADIDEDAAMTGRALEILMAGADDAYRAALAALRRDTREWWEKLLVEGAQHGSRAKPSHVPNSGGLKRFLTEEVLPVLAQRRAVLLRRTLIRDQALGEAADAPQLERLARYEVHLDRKLERMLAMLFKLKELRRAQAEEV